MQVVANQLSIGGVTGDNVRDVDEAVAFQSDVHERGLHAGEHPLHLAGVDVADHAPAGAALDIDILGRAVPNHRDAGFHRRDVDQDFLAHGRSSGAWSSNV